MIFRMVLFAFVLASVAAGLSACGSSSPGLGTTQPLKAPPGEETTFVQDEVLVVYRQTRTNDFQTTTLFWNGSVKNLGNTVRNARIEVLTTRGPVQNGQLQTQVVAADKYGDLLPGQQHLIHVSFTFPNSHALGISVRFAHD